MLWVPLPLWAPGATFVFGPLQCHQSPSHSCSSNTPLGIWSPGCALSSVTTCLDCHVLCTTPWGCPARAEADLSLTSVVPSLCSISEELPLLKSLSVDRVRRRPGQSCVVPAVTVYSTGFSQPPPSQGPRASGGQIPRTHDDQSISSKCQALPLSLPALLA